jgi:hypothetical protein
MEELEQERRLSPRPPVVVGGALIVPAGLLARARCADTLPPASDPSNAARDTARVERLAMDAVMASERRLGFEPRDVSAARCGYDIESRDPARERLRFIEVKGRVADARTITLTRNEILTALNKPEEFLLAVVLVEGDTARPPIYLRRPFTREPDFAVTSVNIDLAELMQHAEVVDFSVSE